MRGQGHLVVGGYQDGDGDWIACAEVGDRLHGHVVQQCTRNRGWTFRDRGMKREGKVQRE